MHETYRTEDGKVKRRREHEEDELEPSEALKKYRGLVLRIKSLREDLDTALEREAALRPAIQDLIDEVQQEAESLESVDERLAEEVDQRLREARLSVQRLNEARERADSANAEEEG